MKLVTVDKYTFTPENFDLEKTLTCGQTFSWHRIGGKYFEQGKSRFYTFKDSEPIIVEEADEKLIVKTNHSKDKVTRTLGMHRDYESNLEVLSDKHGFGKDVTAHKDLNIVKDEPFPCLISYICSSQMRISRIKKMFNDIASTFGKTVKVEDNRLLKFPTPDQLSNASEEDLRDLGLGYRAEYVAETAKNIDENDIDLSNLENLSYTQARTELKQFHGVGDKVADCVLLFSLDFTEAVPLDTWAKKVVEQHFPELSEGSYNKTAQNLRQNLGPDPGIVQEYLFHAARNGDLEV